MNKLINKAIGNKHENHMITLVPTDKSKYKPDSYSNNHVAKYYCLMCNTPINFCGQDEYQFWRKNGYSEAIYVDFINEFNKITEIKKAYVNYDNKNVPDNEKLIYLDVPFVQKDYVKKLGAKWDPIEKQWYIITNNKNIELLFKYITPRELFDLEQWLNNR